MMARRRQGPVNRHWTGFSSTTVALTFGAGTVAATLLAAQHDRETLIRTRGQLYCGIDTASAPGKLVRIGVGMALVPEGTGSTVLWSPLADADAPWFWYTSFLVGYEEMVTDQIQVPGLSSYREVIDSKAMRRVRNQEIQLVFENATIASASAVDVFLTGRFLSQE